MAITYGGAVRNLFCGIDFIMSPGSVGAGTTSVTVTFNGYAGAYEAYSDGQTMHYSGSWGSGSVNYTMSSSNGTTTIRHIISRSASWGTSYGGGPGLSASVSISGAYNGANPSHSRGYTIPARPPSPPNAPSVSSLTNITANNIRVNASIPGNNGAAIVEWQFHWATGGQGWYQTHNGNILDIGGLTRATRYGFQVRARNAAGWGPWSSAAYGTTLALPPSAPPRPTITDITPTSAVFNWVNPSDDGGAALTTFHIQVWPEPTFNGGNAGYVTDSSTPHLIDWLEPAKVYYARVRAVNGRGNGAWSPYATFTTQSGGKVWDGTRWADVPAKVRSASSWDTAVVRKAVESGWIT